MNIFTKMWNEITFREVALFVVTGVLLFVLYKFFTASRAYAKMKKTSRCYKETQLSKEHQIYSVTARVKGRPAFDVTYNTEDNSTNISCACPQGDVESVFQNIPYYDLRPVTGYDNRVQVRDALTCNCESGISADATDPKVTYTGEPGVKIFMHDTSKRDFFDRLVYGVDREVKLG
jgi:hypothetical protein